MRLVSQNGEFDVPYEITSLSRTGNIIRAYVPMVGEKGTVMARYLTDEKAENAMKMLHNTYTGTFFSQNMHITEMMKKVLRNGVNQRVWNHKNFYKWR